MRRFLPPRPIPRMVPHHFDLACVAADGVYNRLRARPEERGLGDASGRSAARWSYSLWLHLVLHPQLPRPLHSALLVELLEPGGKRMEVTKPHQALHGGYETAFASDQSHIAKHARAHHHHHYYHAIAFTPPKSNTFLDQLVLATDFGARSPPIFFSPDPECIQERMRRCRVNGLIATHVNDSTPKQVHTTRTHHTTPPLTRTHARTFVQFLDQRIALTAWACRRHLVEGSPHRPPTKHPSRQNM